MFLPVSEVIAGSLSLFGSFFSFRFRCFVYQLQELVELRSESDLLLVSTSCLVAVGGIYLIH